MSAAAFETASMPYPRGLALATLGAAIAAITGALLATGDAGHGWLWLHWCGKPLATALIFVLAWRAQPAQSPRYRRRILAGIACSLLGDVFLMLPGDLFVPGLVAFLCGHLCFIAAFLGDSRFGARPLLLLASLGYGAVNLVLLWDAIGTPLRVPVIVYVLVLASMGGQALARARLFAQRGDAQAPAARLAAFGALAFMLSDSLLAWNRFHGAIPWSSLWVLSAYYLALWWIARSVQRVDTAIEAGAAQ
ncbi:MULTISPECIES: lysoplasmalogenase [unclassified Rhodanobacter]|uniref:lysoplasmalogenase n=1 Tax=unclassified Rhodanobacter TaxID=2621553 RepID=UPI001BDE1D77|nr:MULTISPECIES: lysoplasmalogenase [unclassified Rhodanobacter]MBT2143864.1 lysoplasmalogenase [Rhodanobacter sp. LX-99]MBT2147062.1 lysoplasmalogenase [Rhodanobacter sp. LX-100]